MDIYAEANRLGEIFYAPMDVYFDEQNIYQPDIFFIATDRLSIVENNVYGAPDLIVEILSPGSEKIDKVEKKEVYERCSVKEYWTVHPLTKKVTGYRLLEGSFVEIPSLEGVLASELLGMTVRF